MRHIRRQNVCIAQHLNHTKTAVMAVPLVFLATMIGQRIWKQILGPRAKLRIELSLDHQPQ
jgi:hypothetical protein